MNAQRKYTRIDTNKPNVSIPKDDKTSQKKKKREPNLIRSHVTNRERRKALAHAVVGLQQRHQRLETIVALQIDELDLHRRVGGQVRKVHGGLATLVERAVRSGERADRTESRKGAREKTTWAEYREYIEIT